MYLRFLKFILSIIFLMFIFLKNGYSSSIDGTQYPLMPTPFNRLLSTNEVQGHTERYFADTGKIQPITEDLWSKNPQLQKNNVKIYGWVAPSYNISSSKNSNIPLAFDIVPNTLVLDQFVLSVERIPNTVQTENIDFGFNLTNILGIDYRYTIAQGVFSGQLYKNNNLYGDDPVEFLGQFYFPKVAKGMLVTVGRYLSPIGIESIFAPSSNFLTHSLSMTYNAYTMTGINSVVQLNKQLNILLGLHSGVDMTPWSAGAHPSLQFLMRWVSDNNNESLYGGIVSLNNGQFSGNHDNLQQLSLNWTHSTNERFKNSSEIDYLYQFNAAKGGSCNFGKIQSFGGGGGCGSIIPGLSNAIGFVNISSLQLFEKDLLSFRFDFFNDPQGQRTGYPTPYTDFSLGLSHALNSYIKIRPELRYEKAYKASPYNNGTKSEQTTFNIDTIVLI